MEKRAKDLHPRVGYLVCPSLFEWVDGFCFDLRPQREMEHWENIAATIDGLWLDTPPLLKRLNRRELSILVMAVMNRFVDVPAQLPFVNDEQVAWVRQYVQIADDPA